MRRCSLAVIASSWILVASIANGQWLPSPPPPDGNPIYRSGNVGVGAFPLERFSVFFDATSTSYLSAQVAIHGQAQPTRRLALGYNTVDNLGFIQAAAQGEGFTELLLQPQGGPIGLGGRPPAPERFTIFGDAGATSYVSAQFAIHGLADPSKRLSIGYDTVNGRGFIQAAQQFVAFKDLVLQPEGGNVLIGGSPAVGERLHVNGDVFISGNIGARYQDVAEWVPTAQDDLEAGMVVVVDPETTNSVRASTTQYDTAVAGVVSARPGLLLGTPGPSKVRVATTGRVLVEVDASQGAVHIGDLLVTSDVRGVAMRSQPITISGRKFHSPGTILGKALEPLESGRGQILVLLSLQ